MTDAWFELPTGRRLDSAPEGRHATFGVLIDATPEVIDAARRLWPQADPDDFAIDGPRWTDRATGRSLRVSTARVLEGDPKQSGVICFVVRGGKFVPLRRPEGEIEGESRVLGVVGGYKATGRERMPAGREIF
jgi:hypothetical protein